MTSLEDEVDAGRLRALFTATNDAFFDVDLSELTIRWSRNIGLVLGDDPGRIGLRLADWQSLIHPDDARSAIPAGDAAISEGGTWTGEMRLRRADGTYVPVRVQAYLTRDDQGRPAHVVGSVSDVSALRGLEDELREANDRLQVQLARERLERVRAELMMQLHTSDVLLEWSIDADRLAWSPNVERVLGYRREDLASFADLHARSTQLAQDGPSLLRHLTVGAGAWVQQFAWRLPGGDEVELEARGYVLRDETGRPERLIASLRRTATEREPEVHDITPRQRQVLSLVRLGHSNKEIAHELGVTEQAAKVQVSKLLREFGVSNRAALAVAGRRYASP